MKPFIAITLSLAFLISTAITSAGDEDICATWVNTEYKHQKYQKRIFGPDGTVKFYRYEDSPSPEFYGTYTIDKKWTDSEQNIWYKVRTPGKFHGNQVEYYFLSKISDSHRKLEFVFHVSNYHEEMNPDHPTYRVYYRK